MISEQILTHPVARDLHDRFSSAILDAKDDLGELTLYLHPAQIVEICRFLKNDGKFIRLSGITAVDWHPADPRFEIVYHLHSIERNLRVRLTCRLSESSPEIDSVTAVWRGANWYEREVYDMFGVTFRNHPDLTRILMPEDWEGHPLRKDYPVHGHKYSYQNE
jgi:NADH-quinone oxidoreductase subunit C